MEKLISIKEEKQTNKYENDDFNIDIVDGTYDIIKYFHAIQRGLYGFTDEIRLELTNYEINFS